MESKQISPQNPSPPEAEAPRSLVYPLLHRRVELEFVGDGSVQGVMEALSRYEIGLRLDDGRTVVYFKANLLSIREVVRTPRGVDHA
jgi:hypothetical protein